MTAWWDPGWDEENSVDNEEEDNSIPLETTGLPLTDGQKRGCLIFLCMFCFTFSGFAVLAVSFLLF